MVKGKDNKTMDMILEIVQEYAKMIANRMSKDNKITKKMNKMLQITFLTILAHLIPKVKTKNKKNSKVCNKFNLHRKNEYFLAISN
jgi:hypothetical protein